MNKHDGSTIESLFEDLGELEEVNARAAKKILAIQAERRMKELDLNTTGLASRMGTSRNQIHRILDQEDAGITLKMLFRLAEALALPLTVAFDPTAARVAKSTRKRSTSQAKKTRARAHGGGDRATYAGAAADERAAPARRGAAPARAAAASSSRKSVSPSPRRIEAGT
jgi:plasmid maintenance system antidote protein VapI